MIKIEPIEEDVAGNVVLGRLGLEPHRALQLKHSWTNVSIVLTGIVSSDTKLVDIIVMNLCEPLS